jgi:hypothetical protein
LSEYSFGYDEGQALGLEEQAPANAEPKWYRDRMDKVSDQMKSMAEELKALRAKDLTAELAKKFEAAGVNPSASALYQGDPAGVDDWLKANGGLLAKLPAAEGQQEAEQQAPQGPPATVVSPEGQAQMAVMQEAGANGTAAPQGSDQEQAAAIAALNSEEDYAAYMRAQGNRFF